MMKAAFTRSLLRCLSSITSRHVCMFLWWPQSTGGNIAQIVAGHARAWSELCRKGSYLLTMKCTRILALTQEGYSSGFSRDPHDCSRNFQPAPLKSLPRVPSSPTFPWSLIQIITHTTLTVAWILISLNKKNLESDTGGENQVVREAGQSAATRVFLPLPMLSLKGRSCL